METIQDLPSPEFPTWWGDYDNMRACDYTDFVELDGLEFTVQGREPTGSQKTRMPLRWGYEEKYVEGYILDCNWKHSLPYKRFGWAIGASPNGVEVIPELDGRWLIAGEAGSLKTAVKDFRRAILRLNEEIQTKAKGEPVWPHREEK